MKRNERWEEDEDALLLKLHEAGLTSYDIARRLGRTISGTRNRLKRLRVRGSCVRTSWTPEEDATLREMRKAGATRAQMADALNRTLPSVKGRVQRFVQEESEAARAAWAKEPEDEPITEKPTIAAEPWEQWSWVMNHKRRYANVQIRT